MDSILAQEGCYTYEMLMVDDGSTGNVLLLLIQNTAFADAALACKNLDDVFIDEWDDTFSIRFPLYQFYHDAILFDMIYKCCKSSGFVWYNKQNGC